MANIPDMVDLLTLSIDRSASDLVLTVGLPPMTKLDGEFLPTEYDTLTPQDTRRLLYSLIL